MREQQAAQLAAAFIIKAGRPIGQIRLLKLMYLAERESMASHFWPIVCDDIYAMREGMGLSRTYDLMVGKLGTPTDGEWDRHIVRTSRGLNIRQGVDAEALGGLSGNDIDVVNKVWREYGHMDRDELVHDVHHQLREWLDHWDDTSRRSQSVPVPYPKLYETVLGLEAADAAEAAEEVAYVQAMNAPTTTQV